MSVLVTVLVAILTAVGTTLVTDLLVAPALQARNVRIQEIRTSRRRFISDLFTVKRCCQVLLDLHPPEGASQEAADAVAAERQRLLARLDEATWSMLTSSVPAAMLDEEIGGEVLTCTGVMRAVLIGDRTEADKIQLVRELADILWPYFESFRGRVKGLPTARARVQEIMRGIAA